MNKRDADEMLRERESISGSNVDEELSIVSYRVVGASRGKLPRKKNNFRVGRNCRKGPLLTPVFAANPQMADKLLRASLEKHNQTFESLLKLIPAKYYLEKEEDYEVLNVVNSKYECCGSFNVVLAS